MAERPRGHILDGSLRVLRCSESRLLYERLELAAPQQAGSAQGARGQGDLTMGDKELHKKVRNAIFLAALGSWEESCTFEELSDDGKQVYEGYATAAMEVYREELEKLRAQIHEMAAKIEAATTTELAKAKDELRATVRQATEANSRS
jgi:hypothetical protein